MMNDSQRKVQRQRRQCRMCQTVFGICLAVSLALIIAGFLVPPMGVIDGSVLTAVGELIVFPALAFGLRAVELGYDLRLSKSVAEPDEPLQMITVVTNRRRRLLPFIRLNEDRMSSRNSIELFAPIRCLRLKSTQVSHILNMLIIKYLVYD